MATHLIISVDDVREVCALSDSVDSDYLTSFIDSATRLAGQNVLGTALMIKLIEDYNNGALTGIYETLYDSYESSVRRMICWQTYQLALPTLQYKIGAAGITVGDTEDRTLADSSELALLIRNSDAERVNYENQVKSFLSQNYYSIPELTDSTPNYKPANTTPNDTSMGLSFGTNNLYTNF